MREVLRAVTKNERETRKLAELLAREILKLKLKRAVVVGLQGELGAGKTAFAKGFAKGLGLKEEMKSPTFILMRAFMIPRTPKHFFHFDAYRIKSAKEFSGLGFKKLLKNPFHIILIEWSERVKKLLPPNYFLLTFRVLASGPTGKGLREIKLLV